MFNINLKDKLEIININSDVDCDTARTDQSIQITSEYLNDQNFVKLNHGKV